MSPAEWFGIAAFITVMTLAVVVLILALVGYIRRPR